ncbi:MAG TPA: penicillin-binding protein 1B [Rhodanobacteraceae bacterium]|nr:penicillin-binding protein 1B [Rhodanobacteraceae bacterium]
MPKTSRSTTVIRAAWRWLRAPMWLALGLFAGFMVPYMVVLNQRVQARFGDLVLSVPTRVYAQPLLLAPGTPMNAETLALELKASAYRKVDSARVPGSWSGGGDRFVIASRGFAGPAGGELPRRVRVELGHGRVTAVQDLTSGKPLRHYRLDPARIATLYGAQQEEREIVDLDQLPPLLVTGLQAVEDRDFKHHHGIDFSAIARAAWADLRAGRIVQGGSTLTQQLVRNLFLDRNQNIVRKANEALLAFLIEWHYDKGLILKTYINEVFLGQRGNQAVHGFAAASQFYFGRRVQSLRAPEIALLVGMVRGPSYYDPRRYPERAKHRRDVVLNEFYATGLIDGATRDRAKAAPLDVSARAHLPHDRFPAFMQLVRRQIGADFDEDTLRAGGLSIFTTLDPAVQIDAEHALAATLEGLGERGKPLQGAVVVTDAENGAVRAVVGGRHAGARGFNRALDARRPVGSLIKPFVYLVALSQPQRWSLATLLDDTPVSLRQPNGSVWTPQNDDHQAHGQVPLVDALVRSWNLATVHLGLALGVERVAGLLESLGVPGDIAPNPSLLLGAIDLSPLQVASLYQYFSAGGHALPLRAVSGVLGNDGKVKKRYRVQPGSGEYHAAASLVTYAMQQVAERGTASAIARSPLARLNAAGKTGTSDDQRDSWFAGFTGSYLAVAWVGRDDNKVTHLWGSSGALKVWMNLMEALPNRPLPPVSGSGIEYAWVDPEDGRRTDEGCHGSMRLPFVAGYAPRDSEGCLWQRFQDILGGSSTSESSP